MEEELVADVTALEFQRKVADLRMLSRRILANLLWTKRKFVAAQIDPFKDRYFTFEYEQLLGFVSLIKDLGYDTKEFISLYTL